MNVYFSFFEGVFAIFQGISGAHLSVGLLLFGVAVLLLPLAVFALVPPEAPDMSSTLLKGTAKMGLKRDTAVTGGAFVSAPGPAAVVAADQGSGTGGASIPVPLHAGQRILVVDDSAVVRAKLTKLLKSTGWSVDTAGDGVQALAMLEQTFYAVMITDLEMPNMNGAELIAHVQGARDTEDLPVIAITGHDEFMARVRDFQGLFGLYKKPWNDRELLQRVSTVAHLRVRPHAAIAAAREAGVPA